MSEMDRALTFAILMENGRGTVDKAPTYMIEKWNSVHEMRHPENLLDKANYEKFIYWQNRWLGRPPEEPER